MGVYLYPRWQNLRRIPGPLLAAVCEGSTFANVGSGLPQLEANRQSRPAEALIVN